MQTSSLEFEEFVALGSDTNPSPPRHHAADWARVASLVPGRSAEQCRLRWWSMAPPHIKGAWSSAEDDALRYTCARALSLSLCLRARARGLDDRWARCVCVGPPSVHQVPRDDTQDHALERDCTRLAR